ncbi:Hydroxymethylglutaryl-CoA synthase [Penicillium riverlandense]|uniref:Hydroxymethylglutaryl-CoA synthase n=1 Tax=Penicillium riverlandense TaxID=1903569 RepID=UPI00254818A6|nr:Hydroxymethylglutaryl-CoA synthase [Penicillium riverlandense]KAJ5819147.1 Hydroxymethylglutaryl-CoA synthase [Penicillium riverlandense]
MTRSHPHNVGIKAMEIYFPHRYVAQSDLEKFLGASAGKHTIGLGQTNMSFCDDREDVHSLALTAVSSLLQKYTIDPHSIGRLEVGTESMLDKAKSCKSVLMQLFDTNTDIEGIDTYNTCYGGTSALFNAVHWIESSAWDGRDAIVVASDIAIYNQPAARPTGGAGCVAMLVGPNAPLILERVRASHMQHTYDFYKADFKSEYPRVDGHYSSRCYLQALDACYRRYKMKSAALGGDSSQAAASSIEDFDHFVFHAPNCKLVAKAYARLLYDDFIAGPENSDLGPGAIPSTFRNMSDKASLADKSLEKLLIGLSKGKIHPTRLISLLSNAPSGGLLDKRIGVFSFGSGLASTMFSLRVVGDVQAIKQKIDLHTRLAERVRVSPEVYGEMCQLREKAYQQKDYTPVGDIDTLVPGTYYLVQVDELFRRKYATKG